MKKVNIKFPRVGQRIIRSVVGVALSFVVYFLRGQDGIPFYTALAVLQCIQPYFESTGKMAKQRTMGTFIGAFWGLVVLMLANLVPGIFLPEAMWKYLLISIFTGFVIYSSVLLRQNDAAYFSCAVFLSITVIHISDINPFLFVIDRVVDTLIGVGLAIIVNSVHIPRKKNKDTLFVAGIDGLMLEKAEDTTLSSYEMVELNRMIADGAKFTVATVRTPAEVLGNLEGINLELPIITMDGAALYDVKNNTYLYTYCMDYSRAVKVMEFLKEYRVSYFTNAIVGNMHTIYYRGLTNGAEEGLYHSMGNSPYRNYVNAEVPADTQVIYIMLIQKEEVIREIYKDMTAQDLTKSFKVLTYASDIYDGYSYLRIYNMDATRENMLGNLKDMLNVEKVVTLGTMEDADNVMLKDSNDNLIKKLKRMFYPIRRQ